MNFTQGEIIYINKPYRMTSFGALAYVRTRISRKMCCVEASPAKV